MNETAAGSPILELRGVNKSFGPVHVLHDVDFNVYPGQVTALVGDNGAGKSTLVKCDRRRLRMDTGEILFEGQPVTIHSAEGRRRPRHRGRVPGPRPVRQPRHRPEHVPRPRDAHRTGASTSRAMEVLGAQDARHALRAHRARASARCVASLSGGQRQTVAIAKAVLWNSKVVLLDEPTAALGVAQTAAGARPRPAPRRAGPRRRDHHAQHERRVRGRRPHRARSSSGASPPRSSATETTHSQVVELITAGPLRRRRPRPRRAGRDLRRHRRGHRRPPADRRRRPAATSPLDERAPVRPRVAASSLDLRRTAATWARRPPSLGLIALVDLLQHLGRPLRCRRPTSRT